MCKDKQWRHDWLALVIIFPLVGLCELLFFIIYVFKLKAVHNYNPWIPIFMIIFISFGIFLVLMVKGNPFKNRCLITPKWRKVWRSFGFGFFVMSIIFCCSTVGATFVQPEYLPGDYLMVFVGSESLISFEMVTCKGQKVLLKALIGLSWLLEAIFIGLIVAAVVNYIGLGKKD